MSNENKPMTAEEVLFENHPDLKHKMLNNEIQLICKAMHEFASQTPKEGCHICNGHGFCSACGGKVYKENETPKVSEFTPDEIADNIIAWYQNSDKNLTKLKEIISNNIKAIQKLKALSIQQPKVSEDEIEKIAEEYIKKEWNNRAEPMKIGDSKYDYINGIRKGLSMQKSDAVEFAEWININGWIRDPFPRKEFNDDKIRYTDIAVTNESELKILTIQELYELFTQSKKE